MFKSLVAVLAIAASLASAVPLEARKPSRTLKETIALRQVKARDIRLNRRAQRFDRRNVPSPIPCPVGGCPPPPPPNHETCPRSGCGLDKYYVGPRDQDNLPVLRYAPTRDACAGLCSSTPTCRTYQYNNQDSDYILNGGSCTLYTADINTSLIPDTEGITCKNFCFYDVPGGPMSPPPAPSPPNEDTCPRTGCGLANHIIAERDRDNLPVTGYTASKEACRKHCATTATCRTYQYNDQEGDYLTKGGICNIFSSAIDDSFIPGTEGVTCSKFCMYEL